MRRRADRRVLGRRALDLAQLEDRLLLSASPMGAELLGGGGDPLLEADLLTAEAGGDLLLHTEPAAADGADHGGALDDISTLFDVESPGEPTAAEVDPLGENPDDTVLSSDADQALASHGDDARQAGDAIPIYLHSEVEPAVRRELVFVDASVEDFQQLLDDLLASDDAAREFDVVLLDAGRDGIEQISEALASRQQLDAVHLVSHGTDRAVKLGSTWLHADNLDGYAGQLAGWRDALSADADLLFYGCELAGGEDGRTLIEAISQLTGADVAASVDHTGHTRFGGDWDLEFALGAIETELAFSSQLHESWASLMAVVTVDTTADVLDGDTSSIANLIATPGADGFISLREAIIAANNTPNSGGPDEIHFDIAVPLVGGAHTIAVLPGGLPDITDAVIIDGTTEPDFAGTPVVVLAGLGAGPRDGLRLVAGSDGSTIRGLVISQFGQNGIFISSDNNFIEGNYLGTDVTGTLDLGNSGDGVHVESSFNTIGGTAAGAGNLISGNQGSGISITATGSNNLIAGNFIGTNAAGTGALGNSQNGVAVAGSNNIIGGTNPSERNVISANSGDGVTFTSVSATGNSVLGNFIGTDAAGTGNLGNVKHGVSLQSGPSNNVIGGTAAGAANTIGFNGFDGVNVTGSGSAGNSILTNSIFSSGQTGIDLAGNANNNQTAPVLAGAVTDGVNNLSVNGSLTSTPATTFRIEFFANAVQDPLGSGEGETYLGATTVVTDGGGNANFNTNLTATVAVGSFISATATVDLGGGNYSDSSEFAINVTATINTPPTITSSTTPNIDENLTVVQTLAASDPDSDPVMFSITGGADAALFMINGSDQLVFLAGPDYEAPADVGADNVYEVQVTADDGNGGQDVELISVTVNPVNDNNPVFTSSSTPSIDENQTVVQTLTATDADLPAQMIGFSISGGADAAQFMINGSNQLVFVAAPDYEAPSDAGGDNVYDVDVTADDASGGTTVQSISVTVNPVNEAPLNTVPGPQPTDEDAPLVFSSGGGNQIAISDVDAGTNPVQVTLNATNGTVTLAGTTGLAFTTGDGTADATMTFTGTITDINTALQGLTFDPTPGFNGAASLQIITDDQGNSGSGGPLSDNDTIDITVAAVNDPPMLTVPGPQAAIEDTNLDINGISVADVDVGAGNLQATLSVSSGVLTLAQTTGLTFSVGDGTSDAAMTFTGSLADVNAALATVTYRGNQDFNGADTLNITVDDQGNTGTGGTLSDNDSINITVGAVNDGPALDLDADDSSGQAGADYATGFIEAGGPVLIADADATLSDVDSATLTTLTVTITNPLDGAAEVLAANTAGTSIGAFYAGGVLTLSGADSVANYEQVLRTVTYDNTSLAPNTTPRVITFVADDGTDPGNTATTTVTISAGNTAPVLDLDANDSSGQTGADYATGFTEGLGPVLIADGDAALTDVDSPNLVSLRVTITNPLDGVDEVLAANTAGTSIIASYNSGTGVLSLSGADTVANYEQVLRTVTYDNASQNPSTTARIITFVANDGSSLSNTGTTTLAVNSVNDPPTTTGIGNVNVAEDAPDTVVDLFAAFADAEDPDPALTYTITANTNPGLFSSTAVNGVAGTLTLDYAANQNGAADITVRATDTGGLIAETTFTVTVSPVNDAPVAGGDAYSTKQDTALNVPAAGVLANDADADADPLTAVLVSGPSNGVLMLNPDGSLTYTPKPGFAGSDSFTYRANDGTVDGNLATVSITVTASLPGPIQDPGGEDPDAEDPSEQDPGEEDPGDEDPAEEEPASDDSPGDSTADASRDNLAAGPGFGALPSTRDTAGDATEGLRESGEEGARGGYSGPALTLALRELSGSGTSAVEAGSGRLGEARGDRSSDITGIFVSALEDLSFLVEVGDFWQSLDSLEDSMKVDLSFEEWVVSTAVAATTGLSVGYILWTIRGGYLIASVLSTMPAWRLIDPLPVLEYFDDEAADGDEETLASLVTQK